MTTTTTTMKKNVLGIKSDLLLNGHAVRSS
jgi:hypothetical protein